jgi:two-component system nitrogen regulation sensor histidine kinase NtrY
VGHALEVSTIQYRKGFFAAVKRLDLMRLSPLVMALALLTLTVLMWPSPEGDSGLLAWLNMGLLLGLSVLLIRYGFRLFREYSEPAPGSRLRAKLVIALVGMLLVPSMAIQIAASQMVERGMDVWFDVRVDTLLDRALNLAQGFYERIEKDMQRDMLVYLSDPALLAAALGRLNYLTVNMYLAEIRAKEGWQKVQLFDINERLIGGVQAGELGALQADPLSEEARLAMRFGRMSSELVTSKDGETAVGYAPLIGAKSVIGLLRVEVNLPTGVIQDARAVEADYRSYSQLERNRQSIREAFSHVMLFITLIVVLVAGLVALLFARRLTAPIGDLAHALRRVTEGDLDVELAEAPRDELGSLVRSFNKMSHRLKQNVQAIEQAQQDLTTALSNSRQRQYVLESLLANLQAGVLLVDANGHIRLLNQSVREILCLSDNWKPGLDITLAGKGYLHDVGDFFAELDHQKDDHLQREFEVELPNGQKVQILARGARLHAAGVSGFSGYLLVMDDVSELAEAQHSRAWAEVARRLAHEIKNPLTPIKLSAERLQRRFRSQIDDEKVFDACTHAIIGQVERLQRLIADFSTLARMPKPKIRDVSVHALQQEMKELFNSYKQIQVDQSIVEGICQCDPDQVRQVLINLMDNAVSATEQGGAVRLYVQVTEDLVEWHIEDDGEGIDSTSVPQLFDAYFSTKASGSGLGLAIAKRIVEDHNGELILVSPAKPTHFCLRLPRNAAKMEES